jgi:predicted membrane protein
MDMLDVLVSDVIGLIGVALILVAYFALQTQRLAAEDWRFSAINGVGALLIMISLYFTFNLASFVIEVFWLIISLYGLWQAWRRRRDANS